jgi:hypothetical protein
MGEDILLECIQAEYISRSLSCLMTLSSQDYVHVKVNNALTNPRVDISPAHLKILDCRLQNRCTMAQHRNAVEVDA